MAEPPVARTVHHLTRRARNSAERMSKHKRAIAELAARIKAEQDQQAGKEVTQA